MVHEKPCFAPASLLSLFIFSASFMSQCALPGWSSSSPALEEVPTFPQLDEMLNDTAFDSVDDCEVEELIWDNGNVAMRGHGGRLYLGPTRAGWGRSNDTLECIVHQATGQNRNLVDPSCKRNLLDCNSSSPSSDLKFENSSIANRSKLSGTIASSGTKHVDSCSRGKLEDHQSCASASATVFRDYDGSDAVGLASFDSLPIFGAKTIDDDSAYCFDDLETQEQDEEILENKKDASGRSQSTKRRRTAAVHNLSERKRRERINQKMKALQKLVPNASKTDKASMLDEVIEYMKQLQSQIYLLRTVRSASPQFVMPIGMQQQLQMSVMAASMGMFDMHQTPLQPFYPLIHPAMANAAQGLIPPVPPLITQMKPNKEPENSPQTPPWITSGSQMGKANIEPYSSGCYKGKSKNSIMRDS